MKTTSLFLLALILAAALQAQDEPVECNKVVKPKGKPIENMVWIPPGTFLMGSPPDEKDRHSGKGPQTQVTISRGFWLSKYEVTQRQYQDLMGNNPSYFKGDSDCPVEQVTWHDVVNYCKKLTQQERSAGRLPSGYIYRPPTEAEWEYACRAGTTTRFSYGDDLGYTQLGQWAWYRENSGGKTHPVGQKRPNPWGLYDMHGNVWEWCQDRWAFSLPGGNVTDPRGSSSGSDRVLRGGSWYFDAWYCRSAARVWGYPGLWFIRYGFRPVLAPGQPGQ